MKLYIDGNINRYYVQTLCMIFFPGEKFPEDRRRTKSFADIDLYGGKGNCHRHGT